MCTHARTPPPSALEAERVVEVLRLVRVDRERVEMAQVDAVRLASPAAAAAAGGVRPPHALVPEEPLEHGFDPARGTEHALEPGPAAPEPDDHEVADRGVAGALAVDDDGNAALEVRLADEELAAPGQLADEELQRYAVEGARASVRRAIPGPRPRCVSGSSTATTEGSSPRSVMSAPAGVRYLAVVSFSAPPPRSGATVCTDAFPKVRSPTRWRGRGRRAPPRRSRPRWRSRRSRARRAAARTAWRRR